MKRKVAKVSLGRQIEVIQALWAMLKNYEFILLELLEVFKQKRFDHIFVFKVSLSANGGGHGYK